MQAVSRDCGRKELGREGEGIAASYLEKRGFRVLERNYRCRLGEVDLIVEKKDRTLLFVEVKTRRSVDQISPLELVPHGKQRHICRSAQYYIAQKGFHDRAGDFALVIVDYSKVPPTCQLIEGIFDAVWGY